MKSIEAIAKIVAENRAPVGSLHCKLQVYRLAAGWQDLVDGRTDAAGNLKLAVAFEHPDAMPAPNLRLLRVAGAAVLSEGGRIAYNKRTRVLSVEFGEIVNLGGAPVRPAALDPRFGRTAHAIGGMAAPLGRAPGGAPPPMRVAQLEKQLQTEVTRASQLEGQVKSLSETNQRLTVEAQQLPKLQADLQTARKTIDQLNAQAAQLPQLRTDLQTAHKTIEQLNAEVGQLPQLRSDLQTARTTIDQLNTEVGQLPQLRTDLQAARKTIDQLTVEARQTEVLRKQLMETKQDVGRLNEQLKRVPELEAQLAEARRANEELSKPRAKQVSMNAMTANISDQISQAQQRISERGEFALASVRVHVKGIVEAGGSMVTLPDAGDLAKPEVAGRLGDLEFDFRRGTPPPPVTQVEVPDLRRLTEGAARQVLHSLGLRLDAVKGQAGAGGMATGQAAIQAPAPGERADRGSTVTVVFAG